MWFNPRYHNFICVKISPFFCHAFVAVNQLCTIALQLCEVHHYWLWSCSKHWYSGPCKPTQTWIACDVCRPPPYTLPHCGPASDWCCITRHDTVQLARESKQDQTPDKTNSPMLYDAIWCNLFQGEIFQEGLNTWKDAVEHLGHCKRNNNRVFLRQAHCIVWVRQSIWCYGDIQKRKMSKAQ